ncbi:hypothetical protein QOL99_08830 [Deinococcus sp. MIMF12]|uniref:Uncharacterized protein n=1 Tax=Deinococcus rhizophilus TaxID=3049544 RepID=A0ABT7JGS1_9DEIO|nr:hypothetical protein [Deinococcus rhizophilus]MDL2344256.1 hypothetical protein [Deinococcus rhizophilus]
MAPHPARDRRPATVLTLTAALTTLLGANLLGGAVRGRRDNPSPPHPPTLWA